MPRILKSSASERREIDLPAGRIRYREAGDGKPIVFVHGFLVDGRLWSGVVDRLSDRYRCLAPDWPMGSHQLPMGPDADLSPYGMADLISSFLDTLDLKDATIVGNDSGGAMLQVLVTRHPKRVGRLVLTNCDTHENFPPGIFKAMPPIAKLPQGMQLLLAPFRIGAIARRVFGHFAQTQIPGELISSWLSPSLHSSAIRHDLRKFTAGMHKRYTLEAAEKLGGFDRPLLLVWAPADRYFPIEYAERLAASAPNAHIVEIPDAKTFVALDQPHRLADVIAEFSSSERQVSAAQQTLAG